MRRVVHWMMKEPELEERKLNLVAEGDTARVELRTLLDSAPPLVVETPEGSFLEPQWRQDGPGRFVAEAPIDQLGLYRAEAGGLEAVALNGPANPKEYADLQSTTEVLQPLADATSGGVFRLNASGTNLPDIRRTSARGNSAGGNWLGLRERGAYAVRSSSSQPLLPGVIAAALLIGLLLLAWRREGR
ncbi:FIG003492: Threonine dehydrogenase and related Zn-dependent dehydrogenases [hydrothermal vent metagenome]|uniref:FIG003492: Threonine dehydrogenase and related Zn-dependent dehydrogenases n=2 Tax=root TaxID=1 RepID=A0A160TWB8_9ZZZZ